MDKNRIRGLPDRTSEPMIAKSTAIKDRGGKSGGRAAKAVGLTSGESPTCPGYRTERVARLVIAFTQSKELAAVFPSSPDT
jgi:hypothetical protein